MKFISLLPYAQAASKRHSLIHDEHYSGEVTLQVKGRVLVTADGEDLPRVIVWIHGVGWAALLFTEVGDLIALAVDEHEGKAIDAVAVTAAFKGYKISSTQWRTLQNPRDYVDADRRIGRLIDSEYDADARVQVTAKMILAEDGDGFDGPFCQVRIWVAGFGWVSVILNEAGDVVAHTVAATEKDAWAAALAVMRRKGYVIA